MFAETSAGTTSNLGDSKCGDVFQLPPLPDMGHGDAGEYALTSEFMQFMHHCNISTVKRQNCAHFINAIREVSTGNVSALL